MKGVTKRDRNGKVYWYTRIDGKRTYCGEGDKGKAIAMAARGKHLATSYEKKEINAGLKVERPKFKTVGKLMDWYMQFAFRTEKSSL